MFRVLAMSDSHCRQNRFTLPEADLFIHAGDFTNFGNGAEEFAIWYWQLPYKNKLLVLGNHEDAHAVEKRSLEMWRKLFGPTLLHNETRRVALGDAAFTIFGVPYGATDFSKAPDDLSILVTHEPPFDVLDRASGGRIGQQAVADFVRDREPRLHVFGHAHESGGRSVTRGSTLCVNAATRALLIDVGDTATVARTISPRVTSRA
jgi:predicted phosphodiesterase